MKKKQYKVNQFTHTINDITYIIDITKTDDKSFNKYSCTVLYYYNNNDSVLTIDRFYIINSNGEFWAWTADLMTQVNKIKLRETIAELLNNKQFTLSNEYKLKTV